MAYSTVEMLRCGRELLRSGALTFTRTILTAYVADGDRVMLMSLDVNTNVGGPKPEVDDFERLVRAAYEYQHDALG